VDAETISNYYRIALNPNRNFKRVTRCALWLCQHITCPIDSTNDEPNSHGYVQYKVKVKDNATVGTVINNTAFIYFDFNAPVVTNTTTNTTYTTQPVLLLLSNSTATHGNYTPTRLSDMVMINLSDNLTGGSLTLSDVTGRALTTLPLTAARNQLNTAELSSGVYIVTAVKGGLRVVQRVVVSR
jgi:hypothetical protein